MARRRHPDIQPASPFSSITLMLLAVVSFIIGLWVIIALVRIVVG